MTEINKHDIKISQAMNAPVQKDVKVKQEVQAQDIAKDYKEAAAAPGMEAAGRAMVMLNKAGKVNKADNIDNDIQKILDNPKLLDKSEVLFNAAEKAGISYPEAATFATSELG